MKPHQSYFSRATLMWLCVASTSHAQLSIHYDFTPGLAVDDNGQLSVVNNYGGLAGLSSITDVDVRLNLTTGNVNNPMYLGDLYSSLTLGNTSETQSTAVLLNRVERDDTDAFGSNLSALNVTLDDSASTNVWAATANGTYKADGRLGVNPSAAGVAFAAGSNGLSALNVTPPTSNRVSLLVADYSQGGVATLTSWGFSTTGVAASTGTFTPGANATLSDTGSGDTNTIGAILSVTGATGGSMQMNFAGTTTFSNGVTGSAGITKTGGGTVNLEGTSSYTGATTISDGRLNVNGSTNVASDFTVAAGKTLGGDGTINGNVTLNGILRAGQGGSTDRTLNLGGTLTANTGSSMVFTITGESNHDQLIVGSVNLANTNLSIGSFTDSTVTELGAGAGLTFLTSGASFYELISGTTTGMFANVSEVMAAGELAYYGLSGTQYRYTEAGQIFWVAQPIAGSTYLVAIPEPSIGLMGSLSLLGLALRRRR